MNVRAIPTRSSPRGWRRGRTRLPEPTRRAIAVNTRTTTQRRRPIWTPREETLDEHLRPMGGRGRSRSSSPSAVPSYVFAPGGGRSEVRRPRPPLRQPRRRHRRQPCRPLKPRQLGHRRARPSSRTKASSIPDTYLPQFDPPVAFTIDREVQHNCAPDFQCRGSIDANLPGWVDLEFGSTPDRDRASSGSTRSMTRPTRAGSWIRPPTWRPGSQQARSDGSSPEARHGGWPAPRPSSMSRRKARPSSFGPIPASTDPGFGIGPNTLQPAHRRPGRRSPDRHRIARRGPVRRTRAAAPRRLRSSGADSRSVRERLRPALAQLAGLAGGVLGMSTRLGRERLAASRFHTL